MTRQWLALATAPLSIAGAASVSAQDLDSGLVIQPAIPQDFNRGRNISVADQSRPDYTALGVDLGGFKLYPRIEAGAGVTSNTYLTREDENGSLFLYQQGSARLTSQWSRHSLQLSGSTTQREYLGESRRNEDLWALAASGRLDLQSSFKLDASAAASRQLQGLFSAEATPTAAALSLYRRDYASLTGTYTQGRVRAFTTLDHARFQFSPARLSSGENIDQSFRDRSITRLTGQVEYARSPSVALFTQASATRIKYDDRPELGAQKLGSKSFRVLGGINVDIAGQVRGTVGLGYNVRDYDAAIYKTVSGLAGEIDLQAFPTERLTFEFNGTRSIEDRTAGTVQPNYRHQNVLGRRLRTSSQHDHRCERRLHKSAQEWRHVPCRSQRTLPDLTAHEHPKRGQLQPTCVQSRQGTAARSQLGVPTLIIFSHQRPLGRRA